MGFALGHIFSKLSEVVPATSILGSGKQKAAISQDGSNENVIVEVTHPKTNSTPVHLPEASKTSVRRILGLPLPEGWGGGGCSWLLSWQAHQRFLLLKELRTWAWETELPAHSKLFHPALP